MPNGELSPSRNGARVSATPSPSLSRSSVMRFALGTAEPARFMNAPIARPLRPFPSAGRFGAAVSATSTSPLGSTYTQRGCSKPPANAVTVPPAAERGMVPSGHPFAGATLMVGISVWFGSGSVGSGPTCRGSVAFSPQAARTSAKRTAYRARMVAPSPQVLRRLLRRRRDDGVLLAAARQRGGDEAVGLLLLDEL